MGTATIETAASGHTGADVTSQERKEIATVFLRAAAAGRAREAFAKYAAPGFRHHNVHFPGDADSLAAAMDENAAENPQKTLEVKYLLAEGDTVVVHSWVRHTPNEPGYALAHFFRFEDDKIAELWDLAQEIPADSPNSNGAF